MEVLPKMVGRVITLRRPARARAVDLRISSAKGIFKTRVGKEDMRFRNDSERRMALGTALYS